MRTVLSTLLLTLTLATAALADDAAILKAAQDLLPTYFTQCGEDYFSKETFPSVKDTYVIRQYKAVTPTVTAYTLSEADRLNGFTWRGIIHYTATVSREYLHGPMFREGMIQRDTDVWLPWQPMGMMAAIAVRTEILYGQLVFDTRMNQNKAALPCALAPSHATQEIDTTYTPQGRRLRMPKTGKE